LLIFFELNSYNNIVAANIVRFPNYTNYFVKLFVLAILFVRVVGVLWVRFGKIKCAAKALAFLSVVSTNVDGLHCRHSLAGNGQGFVQWPIRDPGSRAAKNRSWVKVVSFDQISKKPCQSDMSLGLIMSMSIYPDGHCTTTRC